MKRLRRFIAAARVEQSLFVSAVAAMIAARIALLVWPLHRVLSFVEKQGEPRPRAVARRIELRRAARRIAQAARYCPLPTTCLSETLAAHFIMGRLGFRTEIRIGVSKAGGPFAAHAWLECPDGIVIGSTSADGKVFIPMPALGRIVA